MDKKLPPEPSSQPIWHWGLILAVLLLILVGLIFVRPEKRGFSAGIEAAKASIASQSNIASRSHLSARRFGPVALQTPEEIVAGKVAQFAQRRRDLVRRIALREKKEVPPEVERFFDAIASNDWSRIDKEGKALSSQSGQYEGSTHSPELDPYWSSILDAYGVAEQAHLWPAQKLLDYGNSILDSLRPGMVYVGGTDEGRWIPALLNETSGGEEHIVVTQNAFADSRYVEYMRELYGDRFNALTGEDSQKAFSDYLADARKRMEHDEQFPDQPKQVRPGEVLKLDDAGNFSVSGQPAVMAINERLFQTMMDKNPGTTFAIQQSFPFQSTYESAAPLGPIMEVRSDAGSDGMNVESASGIVEYWKDNAARVLSDGDTMPAEARSAFAKLATDQARLLLARDFPAEAEQTFRLASEMAPANAESLIGYVDLLSGQNRFSEAVPIVEKAIKASPDNEQFRQLLTQVRRKAGL